MLLFIASTMVKESKYGMFFLYILGATLDSAIAQGNKSFFFSISNNLEELYYHKWISFFDIHKANIFFSEGPVALPIFSQFDCPQNKYDLCLDVFFEESEDIIMADVEDPEVPSVLKGFLNSNGNEAVIILKDNTTLEDTVSV